MQARRVVLTLASTLLLISTCPAQTSVTCHIRRFNAPTTSPLYPLSNAVGINRWGNVIGKAGNGKGYIRYTDGRIQTLPVNITGFPEVFPAKRNAFGVTVGYVTTAVGTLREERSFILTGSSVQVFTLSGYPSAELAGINRYGTLVGNLEGSAITLNNSFRYKDGKLTKLAIPVANRVSAISDTGVIVGSYVNNTNPQPFDDVHGFVYVNGVFKDLSAPWAGSTFITDVNATGMIVGVTEGPGGSFIYKDGKFYNPIFVLSDGSVVSGQIFGVNGFGAIVGNAFDGQSTFLFLGSCSF
jgi:hypothetical protein